MDNMNNFEEMCQENILELFKKVAGSECYNIWFDTFDIEISDENHIRVIYHGDEKLKVFKKECKDALYSSIWSVLGDDKKIKITGKGSKKELHPKVKKNIKAANFFVVGMVFVFIASAIIIVMCNYIGNRNFRETFYSVSSIKVDNAVRVIGISDLHGTSYGENNEKLLERVEALEPDVIILTGDIVNSADEGAEFASKLGQRLSKIAPSYYIYGNNEKDSIYGFSFIEKDLDEKFGFTSGNRDEKKLLEIKDAFEEKLEKSGIKVLKNEKDTINVKTTEIDVYGVLNSNPSSFWSYSEKAFEDYIYENPDNLKITAVHEPFIFEEFQPEYWGDLMISGHTHGGVMRVPVIGPLYTHEGGLLPERGGSFVYGRYNIAGGKPLIVSAGLENKNPFRINNQPELVIIDINKF